jgi:Zn-dependent peptidase ImmA (M78 family)/transcriptional regulator with XRE-family HTH domain
MKSGVPGFSGERLREAREAMGLSQTSLSELIGVTKQAVFRYEKGLDSPGQDVYDRIVHIFKQEAHFFLRTPPNSVRGLRFNRSLASTTKTARIKADAWGSWIRELIHFLAEFVEIPRPNFPDFSDLPADPNMLDMPAIEVLAGKLREHWKLGQGPIPDLTAVAESNGVMVVRHALDASALDGQMEWLMPEGIPLVVLNADKRVAVRSRLDLAHELGHAILHRKITPEQFNKPEIFKLLEDQAFRFGAALLLPEHSFLNDLYSVSLDGLRALKPKWRVSIAMMINRLKDLGIIDDEQYRRLRINYSYRQWNRQEPLDTELKVETPKFLTQALQLLVSERIQTPEQIAVNSGFSIEWISRLLDMQLDFLAPKPQEIKILPFVRRA